MGEFWKIIQVILLSSVKFVAGPPFAYYDNRYDFSFFETVLYCVIGGMLGVVVFTFFSQALFAAGRYIKHQIRIMFRKKEVFSEPMADIPGVVEVKYDYLASNKPKKIFTRRNRKIVSVWKRYGLFGIALITPVILSIPIGTLVANSLVSDRKKIMIYMFFSILFWSVLMTSLFELYHAVNIEDLRHHLNF
jgi:hypothetical protein